VRALSRASTRAVATKEVRTRSAAGITISVFMKPLPGAAVHGGTVTAAPLRNLRARPREDQFDKKAK
jgi:hypothetical protein